MAGLGANRPTKENMSQLQPWPIDYDAIQKGDIIPVDRVEKITGKKQGCSDYDFAVLKLKDRIERELHERGNVWTLRTEKGAIKILKDEEAALYNHAEQVRARATEARRFALMQSVDVSKLSPDILKTHERNIEVDGRFIQAQMNVRKELQLESTKRTTPGLPEQIK